MRYNPRRYPQDLWTYQQGEWKGVELTCHIITLMRFRQRVERKVAKGNAGMWSVIHSFIKQSAVYKIVQCGSISLGYEAVMKREKTADTKTILLVEDEPQIRALVYDFLTSLGYNVIQAVDGQDALEKFKLNQQEISLVVTDIYMPRMDGISSCRIMSTIKPSIKVLYMSGYVSEQLPPDTCIIPKPFSPLDLLQAVQSLLGD